MNEIFLVYLITVVISLGNAVELFLLLGTAVYGGAFVITKAENTIGEEAPLYDWLVSTHKKFFTVFVLLTSLVVLIPDKKDFYFIIGGSVALSLSQNEEAQKLPDNVLKALNAFLEETVETEEE